MIQTTDYRSKQLSINGDKLSKRNYQLIFPILGLINAHPLDVRIVDKMGNVNTSAGRVEVYSGEWGTVCDDHPTDDEHPNNNMAIVVCRMLGFDSGVVKSRAFFGEGTGPILMDNVGCTGNETSLFECQHLQCHHDCSHREDVGVDCYNGELFSSTPNTTSVNKCQQTQPSSCRMFRMLDGCQFFLPKMI